MEINIPLLFLFTRNCVHIQITVTWLYGHLTTVLHVKTYFPKKARKMFNFYITDTSVLIQFKEFFLIVQDTLHFGLVFIFFHQPTSLEVIHWASTSV